MAKPNQIPEPSMEEILASIRKIISEDESKVSAAKPPIAVVTTPERPANKVSRLFGDDPVEAALPTPETGEETADFAVAEKDASSGDMPDWPVTASRYPTFDDDPAEDPAPEARNVAPPAAAERMPANIEQSGPLLSPHADAAIASAFSQLASKILTKNSRTVEQMAEEMMRPMLKGWLDENLPPLVERLVREEIERVSRRR